MTKPNVIEMHDITKKFGEFVANDHINLDVRPGEIHALLGENGAGKSTLMNMLSGLLQPTSGTIKVKGQEVTIDSPSKATKLGIGMFTNTLCWLKLLQLLRISFWVVR